MQESPHHLAALHLLHGLMVHGTWNILIQASPADSRYRICCSRNHYLSVALRHPIYVSLKMPRMRELFTNKSKGTTPTQVTSAPRPALSLLAVVSYNSSWPGFGFQRPRAFLQKSWIFCLKRRFLHASLPLEKCLLLHQSKICRFVVFGVILDWNEIGVTLLKAQSVFVNMRYD